MGDDAQTQMPGAAREPPSPVDAIFKRQFGDTLPKTPGKPFLPIDAVLEEARTSARRIGSNYGGWLFDADRLNNGSVVYSFGLGADISWDLLLIRATGCHVHGFDDTPRSNAWLTRQKLPDQFHWHKQLISGKDEMLTMRLPKGHGVSYSHEGVGSNLGFQPGGVHRAQALSISSIMSSLNHTRVDVLKMDIEASEFGVFNQMLLQPSPTAAVFRLPACQLLVEFHSRLSPKGYEAKAEALLALQSLGFTLLYNAVNRDGADDAFLMNPRFCSRRPSRRDMLRAA